MPFLSKVISVLHGTFMYDVNIENLVRAITLVKKN